MREIYKKGRVLDAKSQHDDDFYISGLFPSGSSMIWINIRMVVIIKKLVGNFFIKII